ncbi:MAG TPA: DUF2442 domain-containing protein [Gallionella sp.]|nr:DUF2442 domain-containing protein [Gallionella sp.]
MSIETATKEHPPAGVVTPAPWRARTVSVPPGYRLSVTCNDGTNGVVDISRLVASERAGIFAALKDEKLFNQVSIELGALIWPNGADLDPVWLHEEIEENKTWLAPG